MWRTLVKVELETLVSKKINLSLRVSTYIIVIFQISPKLHRNLSQKMGTGIVLMILVSEPKLWGCCR